MTKRIPLIARDQKQLYTGFLIAAVALFLLCTYLTEFNPMVLAATTGTPSGSSLLRTSCPPPCPKPAESPGCWTAWW